MPKCGHSPRPSPPPPPAVDPEPPAAETPDPLDSIVPTSRESAKIRPLQKTIRPCGFFTARGCSLNFIHTILIFKSVRLTWCFLSYDILLVLILFTRLSYFSIPIAHTKKLHKRKENWRYRRVWSCFVRLEFNLYLRLFFTSLELRIYYFNSAITSFLRTVSHTRDVPVVEIVVWNPTY